jgi:hypothetical protein
MSKVMTQEHLQQIANNSVEIARAAVDRQDSLYSYESRGRIAAELTGLVFKQLLKQSLEGEEKKA